MMETGAHLRGTMRVAFAALAVGVLGVMLVMLGDDRAREEWALPWIGLGAVGVVALLLAAVDPRKWRARYSRETAFLTGMWFAGAGAIVVESINDPTVAWGASLLYAMAVLVSFVLFWAVSREHA